MDNPETLGTQDEDIQTQKHNTENEEDEATRTHQTPEMNPVAREG